MVMSNGAPAGLEEAQGLAQDTFFKKLKTAAQGDPLPIQFFFGLRPKKLSAVVLTPPSYFESFDEFFRHQHGVY